MSLNLTGATRLNVIVGDPIAQVKSPGGMTAAFAARGHDGIVVPAQVAVEDLGDFLSMCVAGRTSTASSSRCRTSFPATSIARMRRHAAIFSARSTSCGDVPVAGMARWSMGSASSAP